MGINFGLEYPDIGVFQLITKNGMQNEIASLERTAQY
jgi:hypothetical protein